MPRYGAADGWDCNGPHENDGLSHWEELSGYSLLFTPSEMNMNLSGLETFRLGLYGGVRGCDLYVVSWSCEFVNLGCCLKRRNM